MSGTSLDGVDGVLVRFDSLGKPSIIARANAPFSQSLRDELLALNAPGENELARAAIASNALAALYADVTRSLLRQSGHSAGDIAAIGAHGQTIRHQPAQGYTIQLNAPALLAEFTDITVIADFRSRDVAAGGQGAPLVPAFHMGVFGCAHTRVILNLGGIANITILRPGAPARGFDTGPANALMDLWCQTHLGEPYDRDGAWGASGQVNEALLDHLVESEPWFSLAAPKSTGRDLFNKEWLEFRLNTATAHRSADMDPRSATRDVSGSRLSPVDVQATLRALTARTACDAILLAAPDVVDVLVCGGGARNAALCQELAKRLPCSLKSTDEFGIGSQDVEAAAFAWLAWAHQNHKPAGLPEVTGARGARILGATWPR